MQTAFATRKHTLEEQFTMARINTAADLRSLIESYDKSLDSNMLDLGDKKAIRVMRDELKAQLEELERSGAT